MEQLEQKQKEQVGASFSLHFFIVVCIQTLHNVHMFFLKAERMRRFEKEKVSVFHEHHTTCIFLLFSFKFY